MAATLEQNRRDGKATPNDLKIREVISCPFGDCESSYTLSYTLEEIRTVGAEKNVDKMRHTAADEIKKEHSAHFTVAFLWRTIGRGPECGWFKADSQRARAAS